VLYSLSNNIHPHNLILAREIKYIPPRDVQISSSEGILKSSDQDTSSIPLSNTTMVTGLTG